MVMQIVALRPNDRETYQDKVKGLCKLLEDEEGKCYRVEVFRILGLPAEAFRRIGQHPHIRRFLRNNPASVRVIEIVREISEIYDNVLGESEINHLRGAVGEVFSFHICRKIYTNAEIEVKVRIDSWESGSIDTAGCTNARGHCLQSKSSANYLESIIRQKTDFDEINRLTSGKAEGIFVTYLSENAFLQSLNMGGINSSEYKVYGRHDLAILEELLT